MSFIRPFCSRLSEGLLYYNEERKAYSADLIDVITEEIPYEIELSHAVAFWKEVASAYRQE